MDTLDRIGTGLWAELRLLSLEGPQAGLALRTAIAGVLSVLAAMMLHLENPYWAGITAVSILQRDSAATLTRSVDRAFGTIAGATLGYVGAVFVDVHGVFLLICGGAVALAIYGQDRIEHGYALLLAAVTVLLVMFGAMSAPEQAFDVAFYRAAEILVGVIATYGVDYALGPPGERVKGAPKPGLFAPPLDRAQLAIALTAGLATAAIPVIWDGLQLPGLGQTPVTAFVIVIAMRREPVLTGVNRLLGCVMGGCYGLACMRLVGDSFVPWLVLLFVGLFFSAHIKHGTGDASYSGHQAAIALLMSMVQGLAPSADILPAIDRLIGIVGGILVVVSAQALVAPIIEDLLERLLGPER
ncbi:FUSC family protein [Roseixanthobacter liquoris]|uniref:FUSC family protein n=1 Tax=Roseixanthobacter liquoris TaxID=3119921 RepID=UPI00372C2582